MIVIGLTGSIGMGKSTVAGQLAEMGAAICSADDIVHGLLGAGGLAVAAVAEAFPDSQEHGAINRRKLGEIVFASPAKRKALEAILHPLVVAEEQRFLEKARREKKKYAVLEIPLLYETGAQTRCDVVVVATAPRWIQRRRVLKRPHMNEARFRQIEAAQLPNAQKCARADFVIQTGLGKAYSRWQLAHLVKQLHA